MKNLKRVALILMAVTLLMTLCSCGGSSAPDSVVGTWKCTNANDFVDAMLSLTDTITDINLAGTVKADVNLEFKSNGTYTLSMSYTVAGFFGCEETISTGSYTYANGTLTLDGEVSVDVKGNSFKISEKMDNGMSITMEFKKQ